MPNSSWPEFDFEAWFKYINQTQPNLLKGNILQILPPKDGRFAEPEFVAKSLSPDIAIALQDANIQRLYCHQKEAYEAAIHGEHVLATTGTNSGKSLCYHLPMLETIAHEPHARGLYLYPTKALAHDQLQKFEKLGPEWLKLAEYDGDTPSKRRSAIRKEAHILFTNPDMLHSSILPSHELWAPFFKSLRLIAIDEMHVYKGVFGSNVANVFRRLQIMCEWHGSKPIYSAASATISNGAEAFTQLTGQNCRVIQADDSESGVLRLLILPPDLESPRAESANDLAAKLMVSLVNRGARVITFNRSRRSAELVGKRARTICQAEGGPAHVLDTYRGGYTAKERKDIEQMMFQGKLRGISTTSALELGIDIGDLDAVIINGYPGSLSSFWQQAGRAGRRKHPGIIIYLAGNDPLECHLCETINIQKRGEGEAISLRPENPHLLASGLLCAAYERAIGSDELKKFGSSSEAVAQELSERNELNWSANRFYYPRFDPPARRLNLRGSLGDSVKLILDGTEIGTLDRRQAVTQAFPGAIYLHRGQSFESALLDLDRNVCELKSTQSDAITQAHLQASSSSPIHLLTDQMDYSNISLSGIHISEKVFGYGKVVPHSGSKPEYFELDLPADEYDTVGVRMHIHRQNHFGDEWLKGIHALEHILLSLATYFAGCASQDLGSTWGIDAIETSEMQDEAWVLIYDRFPGGIGLSEKLYECRQQWLTSAFERLLHCHCLDGCPLCIYSPRCAIKNQFLEKRLCIKILKAVCDDMTDNM